MNLSKSSKKKRLRHRFPPLAAAGLILPALAALFALWQFVLAKPSLNLNGSEHTIVSYGSEYTEKGARASFMGRDVSSDIVVNDAPDVSALGDYEISYTYRMPPFGIPLRAARTVTVEDKKIPELSLNYTDNMTVDIGSAFTDPGWTAFDNYDGELTDSVSVSGEVDTSAAGVYELRYSVSDSNGNTAAAVRTVTVAENSPLAAPLAEFSLEGYFPAAILPESADAGEEYLLETVFVGDSITENFAKLGSLPYANVWYKAGINPMLVKEWTLEIDGAESGLTLLEAAKKYQPKRMIITMGTGSVGYLDAVSFAGYYRSLIEGIGQVSPETAVIVQSVFPLAHFYDTEGHAENNTKINEYNYYLAEMCEATGLKFLNTAEILKNEEGFGPDEYFIDGFHPTSAKNGEIMMYIRTHAYV